MLKISQSACGDNDEQENTLYGLSLEKRDKLAIIIGQLTLTVILAVQNSANSVIMSGERARAFEG